MHLFGGLGQNCDDVAQVVGAGYSVSGEAGDLATFVKLLRVAMLVPIVLLMGYAFRQGSGGQASGSGEVAVPGFLIGFVALFTLNSLGVLPDTVVGPLTGISPWLLLTAVAALGVRTSLKEIMNVGWLPIIIVLSDTVFIATLVIGFITLDG
jgi:uncharacterized membrane protein YadS